MRWIGLVGMAVVLGVAFLLSHNRRAIRWRTVGWAFALQLAFAFVVLYWDRGKDALEAFSNKVSNAIGYADQGSGFLFGWLAGPIRRPGPEDSGFRSAASSSLSRSCRSSSSSARSSRSSTTSGSSR